METSEEMEYKMLSGKGGLVFETQIKSMLSQGWQIMSETDSRTTYRKFSGGKAVGGALLLGPLGLLAGGIGKSKKTGEIRVRLQRPLRVKQELEQQRSVAIQERKAARKEKLEKIDAGLKKIDWYKKLRGNK